MPNFFRNVVFVFFLTTMILLLITYIRYWGWRDPE